MLDSQTIANTTSNKISSGLTEYSRIFTIPSYFAIHPALVNVHIPVIQDTTVSMSDKKEILNGYIQV